MKRKEKEAAIALRLKGLSFRDIEKIVPVSRGTLSVWLKHIRLTDEQLASISDRATLGRERWARSTQDARRDRWDSYRRAAEVEWEVLKNNPSFMFGLALYVGEGTKGRGEVSLANCDMRVQCAFLEFLGLLGYDRNRVTPQIYFHEGDDVETAVSKWSSALALPKDKFRVYYAQPRSSQGKRVRMQPFGTCTIKLRRSTEASLKMERWMELALN